MANNNDDLISNSDWKYQEAMKSETTPPSTLSPGSVDESIFDNYLDLVRSKSNLSTEAKQAETMNRPFDFLDDDEFAFGVNIINNNVACVGDNITKLIQMAQEPWPDNVKLFQPYEVEQILLPDNASCLAVQAFLKMCNLPFEVEMRWNAEFMSPSGRVPFIKCGAFVVSELEPVVQFAANKGVTLCSKLSTEEKAEMRAYMSLITNVLVNAELYISWLDDETFNAVTKVRNSSVYPWPLGWIQTRTKRNAVAKRLKALHWHEKTLEQVLSDVEQCCNSLSQRLGERDYFFGSPTPLDALLYGHVRALLSATGPKAGLMIKPITSSLLRHLLRMINLTKMKLSFEEEYLITQAFQITKRRLSPDRTIPERTTDTPAKASMRNQNRNICGFKPFASKQILLLASKEDRYSSENDFASQNGDRYEVPKDQHQYIVDIVEELMEKAVDISDDLMNDDFEVIHPNEENIIGFDKPHEFLDTIMENDVMDSTFDDTDISRDYDTDGLVNDKLLIAELVMSEEGSNNMDMIQSGFSRSVNDPISSSDRTSENMSLASEPLSMGTIDSLSTLKMVNTGLSADTELECNRRNAVLHSASIADID